MATVTKTTVQVTVGEYRYRANVDGDAVELFRDGVSAGSARWNGGTIEGFPKVLSNDARDELTAAIAKNLAKGWWAYPDSPARDDALLSKEPPMGDPALESAAPKTSDAANHGQMGNEIARPSRQGEAEVGTGGPGYDPNTGELGGQADTPHRRATGDGYRKPG